MRAGTSDHLCTRACTEGWGVVCAGKDPRSGERRQMCGSWCAKCGLCGGLSVGWGVWCGWVRRIGKDPSEWTILGDSMIPGSLHSTQRGVEFLRRESRAVRVGTCGARSPAEWDDRCDARLCTQSEFHDPQSAVRIHTRHQFHTPGKCTITGTIRDTENEVSFAQGRTDGQTDMPHRSTEIHIVVENSDRPHHTPSTRPTTQPPTQGGYPFWARDAATSVLRLIPRGKKPARRRSGFRFSLYRDIDRQIVIVLLALLVGGILAVFVLSWDILILTLAAAILLIGLIAWPAEALTRALRDRDRDR